MNLRTIILITVALSAISAAPNAARAETFGPITYRVPAGFGPSPGRCAAVCLSNGSARIEVFTRAYASAEQGASRTVGRVTQGGPILVAGQTGHWAMSRSGNNVTVAAAAPAGNGTMAIFKLATKVATFEQDVAGWGQLVDGSTIAAISRGGAPAPTPPTPSPAPAPANPPASGGLAVGARVSCNWQGRGTYYPGTVSARNGDRLSIAYDDGDKEDTTQARCKALTSGSNSSGSNSSGSQHTTPPQPSTFTVELANEGGNCTATVRFDGQTYSLGPGEIRKLQVRAGDHDWQFQLADGANKSGRFNVPQYGRFVTNCKPAAPPPQQGVPGAAYYKALAGNTYVYSDFSGGLGQKNTYTFEAGDAECPLVWKYNQLMTGGGMNIWTYYAGCAYFVKELGKDDKGEYQTYWKLVQLYTEGNAMAGRNTNEIFWEGPAKIFTNAVGFYSPRGTFGSRRNPQGVWATFFK